MKVLFIPNYSYYKGVVDIYTDINYPIDILHIFTTKKSDFEFEIKNEFVKKVVVENQSYKYKSLSQMWNHYIESYDLENYYILNDDIRFGNTFMKNFFEFVDNNPNSFCKLMNNGMGFCSVNKYVIDKIGMFDENFQGMYCEDIDYTVRCNSYDKKIVRHFNDTHENFEHIGNITQKTCTEEEKKMFRKHELNNHKYFEKKWGISVNSVMEKSCML